MQLKTLLLFAHPDDEVLFAGGWIQRFANRNWLAVCVTDGGALGRKKERALEFQSSCRALGLKNFCMIGLPDRAEGRLALPLLRRELKKLGKFDQVFTHSVFGELGHSHHQDVAVSAAEVFQSSGRVHCVAWNQRPEEKIFLSKRELRRKSDIIEEIYQTENELYGLSKLASWAEGFFQIPPKRAREIYDRQKAGDRSRQAHRTGRARPCI